MALEQRKRLVKLLEEAMNIADEIYDEGKTEYTREEQMVMDCCAIAQQLHGIAYRGEDVIPSILLGPGEPRLSFNGKYAREVAIDINKKYNKDLYRVVDCKLL